MKKLQSAALLLDFWLGQGVREAAIPAAVLPMLCIALRAAFGRLSHFGRLSRPSNAGQAKKTRNAVGKSRIESFNGRLQDECLNVELFWSVEDARARLEKWRVDHNVHRPHSSLANLPPAALAMSSDRESQQQTESS